MTQPNYEQRGFGVIRRCGVAENFALLPSRSLKPKVDVLILNDLI
ncbi:MAG: hypothetical protein ACI9PY_001794 [Ascidiaceihabitans sp.]|jgi:hypothetical protein